MSSQTVRVTYDLTATETCSVSMLVSDNGGRFFSIVPKALSGDVGDGITAGTEKEIIWDALADIPNISGSDFRLTTHPFSVCLALSPLVMESGSIGMEEKPHDST